MQAFYDEITRDQKGEETQVTWLARLAQASREDLKAMEESAAEWTTWEEATAR
jgi:hypothetical protein